MALGVPFKTDGAGELVICTLSYEGSIAFAFVADERGFRMLRKFALGLAALGLIGSIGTKLLLLELRAAGHRVIDSWESSLSPDQKESRAEVQFDDADKVIVDARTKLSQSEKQRESAIQMLAQIKDKLAFQQEQLLRAEENLSDPERPQFLVNGNELGRTELEGLAELARNRCFELEDQLAAQEKHVEELGQEESVLRKQCQQLEWTVADQKRRFELLKAKKRTAEIAEANQQSIASLRSIGADINKTLDSLEATIEVARIRQNVDRSPSGVVAIFDQPKQAHGQSGRRSHGTVSASGSTPR